MLKTNRVTNRNYKQTDKVTYQKTSLDSGIRVVSEAIPYVRSVSVGIWANAGSRDEDKNQNGISHFVEHMVFKGTKNRSVREIAESLESLGGYLNAFTTKEQTCFYARVLDENVQEAIDVLTDLVQNALFKEEELEKEKLVVIEELKSAEDNPEDIIHDYFEKEIFPSHSLGFPIIGTEENLRRFKREDLRAHIKTHYMPSRIVVAAAGNVNHRQLVSLVEKHFKRFQVSNSLPGRVKVPVRTGNHSFKEFGKPINQAHICLGTVAYGIKHRDKFPLLVLNALLGEGMSSRLYQTLREKYGLAYSVYSFVNALSDTGLFGAYIGTDKNKIDDSIELMLGEFAKLRTKPVSRAELARTKSQIKGLMMLGLENMSGRMMRIGSGELYFDSYHTLDSILEKVQAVTPEAIHRVANDLFKKDRFATVVIRPS
jgi:predicted Zn-dependent peptidase